MQYQPDLRGKSVERGAPVPRVHIRRLTYIALETETNNACIISSRCSRVRSDASRAPADRHVDQIENRGDRQRGHLPVQKGLGRRLHPMGERRGKGAEEGGRIRGESWCLSLSICRSLSHCLTGERQGKVGRHCADLP